MLSAVNVALPNIQADLKMDAVLMAWVATSFLLARLVLLVPIAPIADIFGRKKIFMIGQSIFLVAALASALSKTTTTLLASRVLMGLATAMTATTGVAILAAVFPPSRRGRVMGIHVASVYLGGSIGPTAGGLLTGYFGWRSIFLSVLPLGTIVIFLTGRYLRQEWKKSAAEHFDLSGSIVYMLSMIAIGYGATSLPQPKAFVITALGFLGMLCFVAMEKKAAVPIFELKLFRNNRAFSFSGLAALIHYAATYAVAFMMSLYLQYIKGLPPQTAGLVLISQPVIQAVFSPLTGRMSDRIEPRIIASFGMGLTAVCLAMLVFVNAATSLGHIITLLILLGLGFSAFSSPNMTAIMCSVEEKYLSSASGAVNTMRLAGQMASMAVVTIVFHLLLGGMEISAGNQIRLITSLKIVFIISTIFCIAGIFFSMMRGEVRHKASTTAP